jgi:hypothetical protein
MRSIDRRALAAIAACLAALGACSSDESCDPGCRRAPVPASGPGDTLHYFPAAVGWTWGYRVQETGALVSTLVTSADPMGGETVYAFMTYADAFTATELVAKRPSGAYVVAEPSAEPPFDQLYPSLILPFPVEVRPAAEQVRCSCLDLGDLDGDGKSERADLSMTLEVFSVTETREVPAGSFSDLAHVQTAAHVTVRPSSGASVILDALQDDWFARDVGRVVSHVWLGGPLVPPESETLYLTSWTPGAGAAPVPLASGPDAAPARTPLERAALDLARRAVCARR